MKIGIGYKQRTNSVHLMEYFDKTSRIAHPTVKIRADYSRKFQQIYI
jgi:hypothetical protein